MLFKYPWQVWYYFSLQLKSLAIAETRPDLTAGVDEDHRYMATIPVCVFPPEFGVRLICGKYQAIG